MKASELLNSIDDLPWNYRIYISSTGLETDSEVLLVNLDEEDLDENDEPVYAGSRWWKHFLSISDIQDVKVNLQQQTTEWDRETLIKAINHFYKTDAYIVIDS